MFTRGGGLRGEQNKQTKQTNRPNKQNPLTLLNHLESQVATAATKLILTSVYQLSFKSEQGRGWQK